MIALIGVLIVAAAMVDVLWSTLSVSGAGFVTGPLARGLWSVALALHRAVGSHRLLQSVAPLVILAVVGTWVLMLWGGWTLVFTAEDLAVADATTMQPAAPLDRIYFVGFTLFTLGVGDFVAGGPGWRILTAFVSLNGLFVVTLAITYVMPIVTAATAKRRLALSIHAMGGSASGIVIAGWNGSDVDALQSRLQSLVPDLLLHCERHLAFPVVHYFHFADADASFVLRLAALDDAVTILRDCVVPEHRPDPLVTQELRRAIDVYASRVAHHVKRDGAPLPLPDLAAVREAGVPLLDERAVEGTFRELTERRQWLAGLLKSEGWGDATP